MLTQNQIRILIIDDDEDDYFIISDYINEIDKSKFIIDWCNNYDAAVEKFKTKAYNLYLVDYRLGNQTGLELLQEAIRLHCDDPIILLTGKGNKDIDIEAMKSGATDYLIKSELNTEKLERCIRYSLDRAASLKSIKESENKYRNLFAGSKDALFIADNELTIIEANHTASELLECPTQQLYGRSLYHFIPGEEASSLVRHSLGEGRNITDLEIEIEDMQGMRKTCLLSVSLETTPDNQSFLHGIIHDITNIKKAEEAHLQAEKLAASERLVRILAHEIRNPLNNIKLSADNIKLDGDEKQRALIGIIQRNSIRINQIITELLNSTKQINLEFERYALQEILEESLDVAQDRINLQKIKLDKVFQVPPLYVLADKPKLKIAFSNIIINAIEAMESGSGKLTVMLDEMPESYLVSIKDNGHGIPKEFLQKLFEPFFTLKKNGMGLGLAASYSILKSHNATMKVESHPNIGTTFIMSFDKERR